MRRASGRKSRVSIAIWLFFVAWVVASVVGIWRFLDREPDGSETSPPRHHVVDRAQLQIKNIGDVLTPRQSSWLNNS